MYHYVNASHAADDMVLYVGNMVRKRGPFCIDTMSMLRVIASASEIVTRKRSNDVAMWHGHGYNRLLSVVAPISQMQVMSSHMQCHLKEL